MSGRFTRRSASLYRQVRLVLPLSLPLDADADHSALAAGFARFPTIIATRRIRTRRARMSTRSRRSPVDVGRSGGWVYADTIEGAASVVSSSENKGVAFFFVLLHFLRFIAFANHENRSQRHRYESASVS